jgi:cell shape-determining protein MreD
MKLNKLAAILAFIIGVMALFAGGQVILLGKVQDYYVIDWLPIYNLIMGLVTVFVTSILIWKNSQFAMTAVVVTLAAQATMIVVLQTAYRDVVAPDSIRATVIRIGVWVIILALTFIQKAKGK